MRREDVNGARDGASLAVWWSCAPISAKKHKALFEPDKGDTCILTFGRNIGNAKIQGLAEDLHLTGPQYSLCLTVFFFTYAGTYLSTGSAKISI